MMSDLHQLNAAVAEAGVPARRNTTSWTAPNVTFWLYGWSEDGMARYTLLADRTAVDYGVEIVFTGWSRTNAAGALDTRYTGDITELLATVTSPRLFNVKMTVVELIRGDDEADAIRRLRDLLEKHGFTPMTDDPANAPDAFESEPL